MIGYEPDRDYKYIEINQRLRAMYPQIINDTIHEIAEIGGTVSVDNDTGLLFVNGEITVSLVICRCMQTSIGSNRWKLRLDNALRPDITVAMRMEANNQDVLDYYLLPAIDMNTCQLNLADANCFNIDTYRFNNLDMFFSLTRRSMVKEVA